MAFAKIETSILNHPKFGALIRTDVRANSGLAALGLWALGLAYSMDQLTDGRVPKRWVLQRVRPNIAKCSAEQLVVAGIWEDKGDHWLIHDYLDWNPPATQIKADRQAARERMRKRRGSPERSPEHRQDTDHTFGRTQNYVRQQDVDVDKTKIETPRTASPVRPNSGRLPDPFDWFNPEHWDLAMALPEDKRPPGWTAHRRPPGLRP